MSAEDAEAERQAKAAEQATRSLQNNRLVVTNLTFASARLLNITVITHCLPPVLRAHAYPCHASFRAQTNYCRASKTAARDLVALHDVRALGHRPIKFFAAVRDDEVSSALPHRPALLLSVISIDAAAFAVATRDARLMNLINTPKAAGVFKRALTKVQHPYLAPSLEVAVKLLPESIHIFILRPFYPKGSLRDLLFGATPTASFAEKYAPPRRGSPLAISAIAKLGRQIIEACCYLSDVGMPLFHLHAGNVLIDHAGDARVSDYENAMLGCVSRHHRRVQPAVTAVASADIVAFGFLLLEMATGQAVKPSTKLTGFEALLPAALQSLVPVLDKIFLRTKSKSAQPMTWLKLANDPLFAGATIPPIAPTPFPFDERTTQSLAATRLFFAEVYAVDAAPQDDGKKKKKKKEKTDKDKSSSRKVKGGAAINDDEVTIAIGAVAADSPSAPRAPAKRASLLGSVSMSDSNNGGGGKSGKRSSSSASASAAGPAFKATSSDAAIRSILGDDGDDDDQEDDDEDDDEDDEDDDDAIFGRANTTVDSFFGSSAKRASGSAGGVGGGRSAADSLFGAPAAPSAGAVAAARFASGKRDSIMWKDMDDD